MDDEAGSGFERHTGGVSLQGPRLARGLGQRGPPVFVGFEIIGRRESSHGVVFALSSGEYVRQANENQGGLFGPEERAKLSTHAILYALDAATGKELYSSGDAITSFTHFAGMAVANGRVYFSTFDNTLYS